MRPNDCWSGHLVSPSSRVWENYDFWSPVCMVWKLNWKQWRWEKRSRPISTPWLPTDRLYLLPVVVHEISTWWKIAPNRQSAAVPTGCCVCIKTRASATPHDVRRSISTVTRVVITGRSLCDTARKDWFTLWHRTHWTGLNWLRANRPPLPHAFHYCI